MNRILLFLATLLISIAAFAEEPPTIPVGLDAYRLWEQWPYQRIGARAYMRSTYDRRGGNEGADASHFLYQLADDYNVTLDVAGPGVLYFARYNHWHGSPWHYDVDGVDHLVQETSTANPLKPAENSVFLPEAAFPNPLTWTWSQTKGADLMWVPIAFEKSFQMAYSRTHYGTGYYIYDQYVRGTKLSQPIRAWNERVIPKQDVLDLINKSGSNELVPEPGTRAGRKLGIVSEAGNWSVSSNGMVSLEIRPGTRAQLQTVTNIESAADSLSPQRSAGRGLGRGEILDASNDSKTAPLPGPLLTRASRREGDGQRSAISHTSGKPSMLRALEFSVPKDQAIDFGRCKLRITWDDLPYPSVEAPVALFFGSGTLYNRDNREFLVKSFPMVVRFDEQRVHLACYFPMPYFKSARIEILSQGQTVNDIHWRARYQPYKGPKNHVGYFHATYRDHSQPELGHDLVLLDTRKVEGGGDWSGSFVGTSFIFTHSNNLTTLEGDPRFFFDDSRTPQAQGTGTEEWGGGGDYWGGRNMTLPFAGHPVGARKVEEAKCDEDKIHSAYRFLLADLMPFGKNARIQLEHGGENQSTEHYETVTYWYGAHSPSLIKTDSLQLGDTASEKAHAYNSPTASAPYEISSRYELGVDEWKGREIYPPESDHARKMTGISEFTLKLEPKNFGVMLRRKLDYSFPNQRAEIFVANATRNTEHLKEADWKLAGTWYLAGANTCVYSNPKDELGATQHLVQNSNRRFRDDEFLVPRDLTKGRTAIRIRVKFMPVNIPLYPGQPVSELAWSEIRYDAYCFVMPKLTNAP